ncbi:hypothetical protein EYC84_001498 [Monilinia fructicola]|uniref:FHA domain-containing protein n=1 Tax=Monilinia fructicola TaxID=38448 RepID=A0A5M9JPR5_MONFR|nr:hypothetical protein EYC84_001498 [Monilinia fructicola]
MYHHQVNVHLRHIPVTENDMVNGPAARTLNLTPTQRVAKIGRASKSPNKGLQGATDNAWFDSPVMSRNHAEIIYSPSEKSIQIRDVGSMHGTFVNGEKLGDNIKPLNLNDEIAFGVGVRRGMDVFPACHFAVAYELIPWKKPNSYTVPDSSDEEDEDYNCSEEGRSARSSSRDGASTDKMEMCRSSPKVSESIEAIDLTLYDTPSPRIVTVGSSSISTANKTEEEHIPKSPALAYGLPPEVSMNRHSLMADDGSTTSDSRKREKKDDRLSNFIDDCKNHNEGEGMPSTYDSDMSDSSDPCGEDVHSDGSVLSSVHVEDFDSDVSLSNSVYAADFDDNDEESGYPEAAPGAAKVLEGSIVVTMSRAIVSEMRSSPFHSPSVSRESSPVPAVTTSRPPFNNADIPESHVRTQIDTSEEVLDVGGDDSDEDEEDDASVGLSEAANEGLQTLIKDGLLENKPVNLSLPSSRPLNNSDTWYTNKFPSSMEHELFPHRSIQYRPFDRAASPSAVAMVKAPESSNSAENRNGQSFDISPSWKSRFKSLGDRTGKHAFFEAREGNKMKFQAHVDEYESISNDRRSPSPRPSFTRPTRVVRLSQPSNHFVQPMQAMGYDGNCFNHGSAVAAHLSTEAEINNQTALSPPYLIESSEERPCIHPYYFSSDASSKAPESPVLERYPVRSGLRINDIIDESSTVKTSKRKADEISEDDHLREALKNFLADDVRENEVRNWASSVENFNKITTEPEAVSGVPHQLSTTKVVPSVLATSNGEARPTKRLKMKKFAEAVGYFALGGAAVGAGLFSALVATAPDFL